MTWVKRNLYFLIGSIIAVVLMGLAAFYLFQNNRLNNEKKDKLNEGYTELKRLNELKPNPGNDKVDNIKIAKSQQEELHAFIRKTAEYFKIIPPIPNTGKVSSEEFTAQLRQAIVQLQRDAASASVTLPSKYNFSFEAQKNRVTFAAGSLEPLSIQLGEVRAICDILFHAKINALDELKRERVSIDDQGTADYLERKSVTNELAVLTPFEIRFRCFSPELAMVLAGFASSPNGFIVKAIYVEPAASEQTLPGLLPTIVQPAYVPPPKLPVVTDGEGASNPARRYAPGGIPTPAPTYVAPTVAAPSRGGLPIAIDERPLKVSLLLELVKLRPPK